MIDELYPVALDCGISPSIFWSLSFGEVNDIILSYNRIEIRRQKQIAVDNRVLADQIIRGVNLVISGSKDNEGSSKQIWDYYPDLFKEEKEEYDKQQQEVEFDNFKQRRRLYANQINKKFKGDGD